MNNGTQTLFNWSLRSDSRSIYPHIVRAGFAGFMLLAVMGAWGQSLSGMAPGLSFFRWICNLNVLLISVAGISYFVSAVTEEKDSGTLALLRLAGASPLSIVLSKSTSRLISALMLLLIQLPFTFLAITLGGVTWQQIIAAYLALAAWLCLVANMALFCSVRCSTSGRAAALATAVLLLFFASSPLLLEFSKLTNVSWISPGIQSACGNLHLELQHMSVATRLHEIFQSTAALTFVAAQFWRSIVIGSVLFLLSVLMFNRYSEPVDDNSHGNSAGVRRFTVGRCWKLPIVWKDFLFFTGGKSFWVLKATGYSMMLIGFIWFHRLENPQNAKWLSLELARTVFMFVGMLATIEILLLASNALFLEVRNSTVATLKMLPIPTPILLLQKTLACFVALSPALCILIVIYLYNPEVGSNLKESVSDGLFGNIFGMIFSETSGTMVGWFILVTLVTHLTVLLSLYTRWAALPLAILITTVASPCLFGAAMGLTEISQQAAQLNGIPWGLWIGVFVNLMWMWLFVLLPIEIEIVNRWNRLSQQ